MEPHLDGGQDLGELEVAVVAAGRAQQLQAQLVGDPGQPLGQPDRLVAVEQVEVEAVQGDGLPDGVVVGLVIGGGGRRRSGRA
ncbi:MAG: hypothetical protein ACJ74K_00300 [Actinomycetes bacterium]